MYCHGISTLMLAEVVGMTDDPELAEQAPRGTGAGGQADPARRRTAPRTRITPAAGATSRPADDSDISVTGWQLMALRAAKSAGCAVPSENIDRAVDYLKRCAVRREAASATSPAAARTTPGPAPASSPWRSAAST